MLSDLILDRIIKTGRDSFTVIPNPDHKKPTQVTDNLTSKQK